jgi:hypothetical protein
MFEGYIFYAIIASLVFIITALGLHGASKINRTALVASFIVFLPVTFFATMDLLSRPRPVELMMDFQKPDVEKAKVLAVHMVEGEYIMILLTWDGLEYPRYFRYAWDQEMAEQMSDAQNRAQGENGEEGEIELQFPFDQSLERRELPWAHPIPQFRIPQPKNPPAPDVFLYDRDA